MNGMVRLLKRKKRKLSKITLVVLLVTSWLLTGWMPVWILEKKHDGGAHLIQLKQSRTIDIADAATSGPNTPSTVTGTGVAGGCTDNMTWTITAGDLTTNDSAYVDITGNAWDATNVTDELRMSGFSFSLTGSVASIDGFQVDFLGWTSGSATYHTVSLFTTPGTNRGDNKATGNFPNSDPGSTYTTFGSTSDDWYPAGTWTQAEVESANFGVVLCVTSNATDNTMSLDQVRVTITYSVNPAFSQAAFAFYEDGTESGSTIIGSQDTNLSRNVDSDSNVLLRIRVQETAGGAGAATDDWQLRYSRNSGAYASVTTGTSYVKAFNSANLTDAGATTNRLTGGSGSFVAGVISEDGLADNHQITASNYTEYLFTLTLVSADLQNSDTLDFELQRNGVDITFSKTPRITATKTTPPSYTQNHYKWYVNPSPTVENVSDIWPSGAVDLGEDTILTPLPVAYDPPSSTQELRLRINITVNANTISNNTKYFKLRFRTGTDSDCSTGTWTDVGAAGGADAWVYTSDTTIADDTALSVAKLTATDRLETYSRVKPANTPIGTSATGEDIEFDFHIVGGTGFTDATRYLFRVVETDSGGTTATALTAYTNCPVLHTEPGTANQMRHGEFFSGEAEQGFFWAD